MSDEAWPKIGRPATRALTNAGYRGPADLDGVSERELKALHGMGPKALGILKEALAADGKSLAP
jgi:hypothetical protein